MLFLTISVPLITIPHLTMPFLRSNQIALQMPKTSVESIELIGCECEELNVAQIQQLLSYYQGEGGATVPASWIQEGLQKRAEAEMRQPEGPQPLLVDLTRIPPIAIPYTPKDVLLSEVNPPDFLQLDMLRKI
eukprot:comp20215_c0_seq3/m.25147 comp20215_c0_seq3/g.25147  ORF comp20215_c0_seq3/g.25147 comp20215_c0_seq3/m.25147 type:complete len:133 (-) comp20215_c0_seq3:51-449(-)